MLADDGRSNTHAISREALAHSKALFISRREARASAGAMAGDDRATWNSLLPRGITRQIHLRSWGCVTVDHEHPGVMLEHEPSENALSHQRLSRIRPNLGASAFYAL